MVNFRMLAASAKRAVDAAGGPEAVKQKAEEMKKIAQGSGTLSEKAKRAAVVAKEDHATPSGKPAAKPRPAAKAGTGAPAKAPKAPVKDPNAPAGPGAQGAAADGKGSGGDRAG